MLVCMGATFLKPIGEGSSLQVRAELPLLTFPGMQKLLVQSFKVGEKVLLSITSMPWMRQRNGTGEIIHYTCGSPRAKIPDAGR